MGCQLSCLATVCVGLGVMADLEVLGTGGVVGHTDRHQPPEPQVAALVTDMLREGRGIIWPHTCMKPPDVGRTACLTNGLTDKQPASQPARQSTAPGARTTESHSAGRHAEEVRAAKQTAVYPARQTGRRRH